VAQSQRDQLKYARSELSRSKKWRKDSGLDDAWTRYVGLYKGEHYSHRTGTDQLVVNMIFSTMNVMAPAVAINNPRFVVNARSPESSANAIITEEVLNYLWRKNDYHEQFRLGVADWLMLGHAWYKVGYKFVKEERTVRKVEDSGSEDQVGVDDRDPEAEGNDTETEMHIVEDRPFLQRISPKDVYVDPDARHPSEMRWIAQRTWRAEADVRIDKRYDPGPRKRVEGSHTSPWDEDLRSDSSSTSSDAPTDGPLRYVEVVEFYDIRKGTVGTFAADNGDDGADEDGSWLIKPKKIPYALGHPFTMMRNHEVPDHFYPLGDVSQIEPLQLELNETRTQMLNYRKKYRRGYAYDETVFISEDAIEALQSEEDNVLVPANGSPDGAIVPLPVSLTPSEFFDQSAMITDDLNQVSGVSDYARGNPQQFIKRTATEASMIQDASNARSMDRLAVVEQALADLGSRVVALMQQYLSSMQVARITTIPVRGWVNFDKDYIQGEFDFEVRGGSTEPQNEMYRRQSAIQLVDAAMPFLELGVADPAALWMKVLRDGFGEKDAQRYLLQQPPPMEEEQPPPEQMPPDQMMPPGEPPMMPPEPPMMPPEPMGPLPGMPAPGAEMTPELLAALLANERGMPPVAPPEQFVADPQDAIARLMGAV
jgi:hypothetical protein